MFGRKKKLPAGIRFIHYEGLPSFPQDGACFMEQTADALIFRQVEGASATLPLEKVCVVDVMQETDFAARYRGTGLNTSKTNAVKWYAVITYDDNKRIVLWFLELKAMTTMQALQRQIASKVGNYIL